MKIAILGAGAMGSFFGGKLALGGNDVTLLDVNEGHIAAINQNGLKMELDEGEYIVKLQAVKPAEAVGEFDLIVLFTKTIHTEIALGSIKHLLENTKTCVLTIQNGLGNMEKIEKFIPKERIYIGMTKTPADIKGAGYVASHGLSHSSIMPATSIMTDFSKEIENAFVISKLGCEVTENVLVGIWEKVAFNVAVNALCAICRVPVGGLGKDKSQEVNALARAIIEETVDVAHAVGVKGVSKERVLAHLEHAITKKGGHKPSMLVDILNKAKTEVDTLNGAVVDAAASVGIEAPLNSVMKALIKGLENDSV